MLKPPLRFIITLTKDQWILLMTKTRSNVELILDSIEKTIGTPSDHIHPGANIYGKFIQFVALTHAVEEYGKLLYVLSLTPNANGKYEVEYNYDGKDKTSRGLFKNHNYKFGLAEKDLGPILTVRKGSFSDDFQKSAFDTDTKVEWDARLNILNTDIDQDGNPTNIYSSVDLDMLRQSVCDFKPKVMNFQIPG